MPFFLASSRNRELCFPMWCSDQAWVAALWDCIATGTAFSLGDLSKSLHSSTGPTGFDLACEWCASWCLMVKNGNGTWEPSRLRTSKHLKNRSWHHLYHPPHPNAICCRCIMPLWMRFFDILGRGAVMLMEIQGMHVEHLGTFGVSRFLFENPLNSNHGLSPSISNISYFPLLSLYIQWYSIDSIAF